MAEQIISPGVFTRENDLSFLPAGVGAIGAAIVGPTVKGPAFVPTVVRSFAEYERRFGGLHKETFIPQTVREYLKNAGSVTVCRVLAGGGYEYVNGTNEIVVIGLSGSRSTAASLGGSEISGSNVVLSVLFPSKATSTPDLASTTMVGPGGSGSFGQMDMDFSLTLKGATGGTSLVAGKQLSASMNPDNDNYLIKQLGYNPNNSKTSATGYGAGTGATGAIPAYTYNNWEGLQSDILAATTKEVSTITFGALLNTQSMVEGFAGAALPDISQSIVITSADNKSTTILFSTSSIGSPHTNHTTGSVVHLDTSGVGIAAIQAHASYASTARSFISGSDLANLITGSIQTLIDPGFSVSAAGNILTITNTEAGTAPDIILKGFLTTASASLSTTTQGADVSGYVGINADRDLIMTTLGSGALCKFDGGIGQTEGYGYATTPWIKSQFLYSNKTTKELFKFHTISHGTSCNMDYKISIANLKVEECS